MDNQIEFNPCDDNLIGPKEKKKKGPKRNEVLAITLLHKDFFLISNLYE